MTEDEFIEDFFNQLGIDDLSIFENSNITVTDNNCSICFVEYTLDYDYILQGLGGKIC